MKDVGRAGWRVLLLLASTALGALLTVVVGWTLWFGLAWATYGRSGPVGASDQLVDRFMPAYEVAERHAIRVAAPVARTFAAARGTDLLRAPIVRAVLEGRRRLFREPEAPDRSLGLGQLEAMGWRLLAAVPGRELVFGAVTQPWQGNPGFRPLPPETFAAFDSAGYAKIVWTLAADSLGANVSRFRTETRVTTTDAVSRALFRRYWSLLSPGIVLIRWQAIRLVRADAERLIGTAP